MLSDLPVTEADRLRAIDRRNNLAQAILQLEYLGLIPQNYELGRDTCPAELALSTSFESVFSFPCVFASKV
jgi:hypothetical protein